MWPFHAFVDFNQYFFLMKTQSFVTLNKMELHVRYSAINIRLRRDRYDHFSQDVYYGTIAQNL